LQGQTNAYLTGLNQATGTLQNTLGNQLGRWAVHLDFSVIRISQATGASRQSVYNWFNGGEVFVAYRPAVSALLKILQSSSTADEAWRKACKAFNLET
jgi:hypothetical protein